MPAEARHQDPIAWFHEAFSEAQRTEAFDASRAALATTDPEGRPTVRFVLVKHVDERGFCFFTNTESVKGQHLAVRPFAAVAFHWSTTGVQIRVEGDVERMSAAESDAYFAGRPRGSQIAAWCSEQSHPIGTRRELETRYREAEARFEGTGVPRPEFWGGFRLVPRRIEFWENRDNRLHDRWSFTRTGERWDILRLQP